MKLHFMGTGSSHPTTKRGVSATALQLDDGSVWLFDCGEGTQIQAQKVAISKKKINKIFITHLHGDHLFGLPGLLCTISSQTSTTEAEGKSQNSPVVDIYGPVGLRRFINTSLNVSRSLLAFKYKVYELVPVPEQYPPDWGDWSDNQGSQIESHPSELTFNLVYPIIDENEKVSWNIFDEDNFCVIAGWIHHRVPTFGYIVQEKDRPGTLDTDKLLSLGLKPGPLYGQLKSGRSVTMKSGQTITPEMVLGPSIPGRKVVVLGDTNNAMPLAHLINECDVLVHEATHDDSLAEKAEEFGHSTPKQAAEFAKLVCAKTLLLNHFSQRYYSSSTDPFMIDHTATSSENEQTTSLLIHQAKVALQETTIQVQCAEDLFVFTLPTYSRNKTV